MAHRSAMLRQLGSILCFTAVAAAWALFILAKGGGLPDFGPDPYKVSAVIPTGAALAPGSRVTMAGVHVGTVKKVKREGAGALLQLEVEDEAVLPLAADTRVQVRQHTPVGENYIALIRGKSTQKLESGSALLASQAEEFVDVDKVLSVLKGKTRQRARETIQGLGGALDGRGVKLNKLLGGTARFLKPSARATDALYRNRVKASRLIDELGDVSAAIGQRDEAIRTLADQGVESLRAVASRDAVLRRTIDELPPTLRRVRSTSNTLRTVSQVARPVVDDTAAALTALRPSILRLDSAGKAGSSVLAALGGASPGLQGTLEGVTTLSGPLAKSLPRVLGTVCQAAPVVRYLKPYLPEALYIAIGLGSVSNSYDATGHLLRLAPILSENSISGQPKEVSEAANTLLYSGLLARGGTKLNFNPYPKPGELGRSAATSNEPRGPEKMSASGYKYPRVEADC